MVKTSFFFMILLINNNFHIEEISLSKTVKMFGWKILEFGPSFDEMKCEWNFAVGVATAYLNHKTRPLANLFTLQVVACLFFFVYTLDQRRFWSRANGLGQHTFLSIFCLINNANTALTNSPGFSISVSNTPADIN